ncbi:MAG: tripartite tricarboxylate transporter substrate binding protein [Sphingomonadales bacterium]|nr:tripartite tricarboxylate transporter substrate binding protein [Sphingomonadales bacterium]
MKLNTLKLAIAAAMAIPLATGAAAQADYPEKPVQIVVPFGPGGAGDIFARVFVNAINENNLFGQPMVVVNEPGGGTTVGSGEVKDAAPDGYTILQLHQTLITSKLMGTSDYGPEAFDPIAETHHVCMTYASKEGSGLDTLDDVRAMSAANPGSVKEASLLGSLVHFSSAMLNDAADLGVKSVNVGGGGKRNASVLGGHTQTMVTMPFVVAKPDSGFHGLAFLGAERHPALPDVPTAIELGYDVEACVNYWWFAPKGTPADRVAALADAFAKAAELESVVAAMTDRGVEIEVLTGAKLQARIDANVAAYTAVAPSIAE